MENPREFHNFYFDKKDRPENVFSDTQFKLKLLFSLGE